MGALYIEPSHLALSLSGDLVLTHVLPQSESEKRKYVNVYMYISGSLDEHTVICQWVKSSFVVCFSHLCFLLFLEFVEAWCGMDKQQQNSTVSLQDGC